MLPTLVGRSFEVMGRQNSSYENNHVSNEQFLFERSASFPPPRSRKCQSKTICRYRYNYDLTM